MLLFRSEEHVHNWCQTWKLEPGGWMSLEQGWQLAQGWYGPDRRDPAAAARDRALGYVTG